MADKKAVTLPSLAALEDIPTGLKYLTLPEGILELIEVVFNILGFILVTVDPNTFEEDSFWHYQAAAAAFAAITGVLIILYMTGIVHKIKIPWSLMEVVYCCLACLLMLVVASHLIVNAHGSAIVYVACVMGFIVAVAYLIEIGFAVRAWKRSIIAETLRMVEAHNNINVNVENSL
ncbi:uncharacterized protein [Amphiura filiformis]|uniref:uncharacterized protein n=1 Tax=Amphiura filiformis TaxID=82378 RepID=UPI003B217F67